MALVDLEQGYDVRIITHNVDDLHEGITMRDDAGWRPARMNDAGF
jgi:NAD-dependent SIR2 family protein deacetylase